MMLKSPEWVGGMVLGGLAVMLAVSVVHLLVVVCSGFARWMAG